MYISRPKSSVFGKLVEFKAKCSEVPFIQNGLDSWCSMPPTFDAVIEQVLQFEVRSDDVFLVTFMKSGTTWMQETAWMLLNDLDYKGSAQLPLSQRSPFIEYHGIRPSFPNALKLCEMLPSPRLIKSHLPANLLPHQIWKKKTKLIYVARNCKDVIVSSYHFTKALGYWSGDNIADYVNDFMNNDVMYTSYWSHVVNFWKIRNKPNIFFVTYEEMKRNLKGVIERLCEFLEKPQLNDREMEQLLEHLSFDNMKENKQTNATAAIKQRIPNVDANFQFMRRGIVGSYKDELTPELKAKIDVWSKKVLDEHGLSEEDIFGKL
ncbi:luciferin sulfotransferase-like [Musca autumnalis]|uniref:luciferin sulfotransferase-like n=1 Tax=Musca autumnalis TaxID=221902 RepID=UPI003CED9032